MNLPAEQELIGALMLAETDEVGRTLRMIRPECVAEPSGRRCLEAIQAIHEAGNYPGAEAVADATGLHEYVADIVANVASAASLDYFIDKVFDAHRTRELEKAAAAMSDDLMRGAEADAILDALRKRLQAIPTAPAVEVDRFDIRNYLGNVIRDAEAARDNGGMVGVPTGLGQCDANTLGMRRGEVTIIAAKRGCGKSTLLANVATNVFMGGGTVVFFSLEMQRDAIIRRIASSLIHIPEARIAAGNLAACEWATLTDCLGRINDAAGKLIVIDDIGAVRDAHAFVGGIQNAHQVDLVVFDYLQHAAAAERGNSSYETVSAASAKLQAMARDLRVPVLSASQLRRGNDDEPRLDDLRDSGKIEQDAAVVAFIHTYKGDSDPTLLIRKNRNGPSEEDIPLAWDMACMKFEEAKPRMAVAR